MPTLTPAPEFCVLQFKGGTSNKEYQLRLEQVGDLWQVIALYGAIGDNLRPTTKCKPSSYEIAKAAYDKTKKEKLTGSKGDKYSEVSKSGATMAPTTDFVAESLIEVELLTPIDIEGSPDVNERIRIAERALEPYITNPRYWFQEKADGDRAPVRRDGDSFSRYNRKGELKPLISTVADALSYSRFDKYLLDGEIEGESYWAFSALEVNGEDLRSRPFSARYRLADNIMSTVPQERTWLLQIARNEKEKRSALRTLAKQNAEGVVVIDSEAPFKPGRAGQHFKLKFVVTATVRVRAHSKEGKRSVEIELLGALGEGWLPFGSCSIPEKHGPLPNPGTLIECRYLYGHKGEMCGSLNQPVYLRVRNDLDESAATISQIKFKRGE